MSPFFPIGISVFGGKPGAINGCTTIHSATNDNGYLGCVRGKNPLAGGHNSTSDAVTNLLQCLGAGVNSAHIVGHGSIGSVTTGTLSGANDPNKGNKILDAQYHLSWEPFVKQLSGKVSSLTLWACHPGAGNPGANLLFLIAQAIKAPVLGPTGFIFCGNRPDLYLEHRATWQIATPDHHPAPIGPPSYFALRGTVVDLKLNYNGQVQTIPLDHVISVEVTRGESLDPDFEVKDERGHSLLYNNEARSLLRLVQFDEPFQPGGVPGAMITGRAVIKFVRDKQEEQREFVVYNHLLLQDKSAPDTFYYCNDSFRDAWESLL